MQEYVITTENAADLPQEFIEKNQIGILSLSYTMDGVTYGEDSAETQPVEQFYQRMRDGSMPKTQQVNPDQAIRVFREYLKHGKDILHVGFTSAVSGSYNSICMAAQELREEFPQRKIEVVDTLVGTLAEGMLVDRLVRLKQDGAGLEEAANWLREYAPHACLYATVDDLKHLYRGGRVSKTSAFLGTAIGIKPVLKLNEQGNLVPVEKVRGRKASVQALLNQMEKHAGSFLKENDTVYISHGDCLDEALALAQMIKEKFGIEKTMINHIGPVIGSHAGPGAIALAFFGETK